LTRKGSSPATSFSVPESIHPVSCAAYGRSALTSSRFASATRHDEEVPPPTASDSPPPESVALSTTAASSKAVCSDAQSKRV
jgi:hypothetical protein